MKAAVLECLKRQGLDYLSGGDIGRRLGISRAAVWKHISALRDEGYRIEARSRHGYRLVGTPDLLLPAEVRAGLTTDFIGRSYHHYHSVPSTNDTARDLARKGAPEGSVVVAEKQEGGRGRLGRGWHSPRGGLWVSVILRPTVPPVQAPQITFVAAVAAMTALQRYPGLEIGVKWPNDLVWEGRKLGGILTEMAGELDRVRHIVLGIGLNVNLSAADFPPALRKTVTSLSIITGRPISRPRLLRGLLAALEDWYRTWVADGFTPVLRAWKRVHYGPGRLARVVNVGKTATGIITDVDEHGALLLRTPSGEIERVVAGDVMLKDGEQL